MTRVVFEEVAIHGSKSGICPGCGSKAKRKNKFWQTISPFNRKTREEILAELKRERYSWLGLPVYHAKCETAEDSK